MGAGRLREPHAGLGQPCSVQGPQQAGGRPQPSPAGGVQEEVRAEMVELHEDGLIGTRLHWVLT